MTKLIFVFVFFLAATGRCFAVDFGAVAVANWSDDAGQIIRPSVLRHARVRRSPPPRLSTLVKKKVVSTAR